MSCGRCCCGDAACGRRRWQSPGQVRADVPAGEGGFAWRSEARSPLHSLGEGVRHPLHGMRKCEIYAPNARRAANAKPSVCPGSTGPRVVWVSPEGNAVVRAGVRQRARGLFLSWRRRQFRRAKPEGTSAVGTDFSRLITYLSPVVGLFFSPRPPSCFTH